MSRLAFRLDARLAPHAPAALLLAAASLGVLTAWDPRMATLAVAAVASPALVWADPRVTLALAAVSLGVNLDVITTPVHVSLPQLVTLALLAGCAVRPHVRPLRTGLWANAGFFFVLSTLPSVAMSAWRADAFAGLVQLAVLAALLAATVRLLIVRPQYADRLAGWLICGAVISVIPAFVQVAFDIGPAAFRAGSLMRAYSTFSQPNTYGGYLAGMLPFAAGWAWSRRGGTWLVATGSIGAALVLTGSRGAWAGALLGLVAMYAAMMRLRLRTLAVGMVALLCVLAVVALVPDDFILGRFDFTDWSTQQRLLILLTAWDGVMRNPVAGYGGGAFEHMLPSIARIGLTDDVAMPHNLLLHIWFELGLAALLCFLLFTGLLLGVTFRAARRTRDARFAALLGAMTGMLGAAMFGTLFIRGLQETFVMLIALAGTLVRSADQPSTSVQHADPVSL